MFSRTEAPKAEKAFDRKKALNNQGFMKFLGSTREGMAGTLDMEDTERLKELHDVFEKQAPLSNKFVDMWTSQILKDTKVKLTEAQKTSLKEFIATKAANNPEELEALGERMGKATELPKEIEKIYKQIQTRLKGILDISDRKDLADRIDEKRAELEEKRDVLKRSSERNFFGRMWERVTLQRGKRQAERQDAAQEALDRYGIKEGQIEAKLDEVKIQLETLKDHGTDMKKAIAQAEALQAELTEEQVELFARTAPAETINNQVADIVKTRVASLASSPEIGKRQEALIELEKFASLRSEGRDYIQDLDADPGVQDLDPLIENEVTTKMGQIVREKELGFAPLDDLSNALKNYLKMERVGKRTKEQTRQFLLDILKDNLDKLAGDNRPARALVIKGLIISLQQP